MTQKVVQLGAAQGGKSPPRHDLARIRVRRGVCGSGWAGLTDSPHAL